MNNNIDRQYLELVNHILRFGNTKQDRTGTGTKSIFGWQIRHSMKEGFPLLTTKKMAFKTMTTELLWFLRGDTNIKYLVDNGCHIWDGDAYKNYKTKTEIMMGHGFHGTLLSPKEFINKIKTDDEFAKTWGELGPVYGMQWRGWVNHDLEIPNGNGLRYMEKQTIDQIANAIHLLKTDPDSRRILVNAWNVGELDEMVLPPCHYSFQFYTRELSESELNILYNKRRGVGEIDTNYSIGTIIAKDPSIPRRAISLLWNQRSVDVGLGLPFNIASYALLLEIIAKEVNMIPEEVIGNLGDCHIYLNHEDGLKEQLTRIPYELPKLDKLPDYLCIKDDWECYKPSDFNILNYQSHPAIKLPLSN
jgi:thymidylate synthase